MPLHLPELLRGAIMFAVQVGCSSICRLDMERELRQRSPKQGHPECTRVWCRLELLTPDDLVDVVHSVVQLSTDPELSTDPAHTSTQPPAPAPSPSRWGTSSLPLR